VYYYDTQKWLTGDFSSCGYSTVANHFTTTKVHGEGRKRERVLFKSEDEFDASFRVSTLKYA
jgi:hypothetical protein